MNKGRNQMLYNKEYETLKRDEINQLQIERLQSTLNRVYRNVSFYKESFDNNKINIEDIKSVEDLVRLPFTEREDISSSYPYGMFAVPLRDIVRIHSIPGCYDRPVVSGYTKNDNAHWIECSARLLTAAGITDNDVVQMAFNYNFYSSGFGFHHGAEVVGASVIPYSFTTHIEKQIQVMKDFKTTVLICSPGYALKIASSLNEMNIHPEELNLRTGIFSAEPWSEKKRKQLEDELHINALDSYGLTEILGPGVAGECEARNGLHVNEDHFICEIINPESLEHVKAGEEGELVITTITKEGFPLIRYRTGNITSVVEGECSCGRTFTKLKKITKRTDDLIFFKEGKMFPSQIKDILAKVDGTENNYQIIIDSEDRVDKMEIKVEISEELPSIDELKTLENLRDKISEQVENTLGFQAKITLVGQKLLNKAERIIDKREI
jgi:phenylacetate-CoA ligase